METKVQQFYSKFGNQSVTTKGDRVVKLTEWNSGVANSTERHTFGPKRKKS